MTKFLEDTKLDFVKFKRSAQKEVNYLVKEFECKKSAGAYARATTSRTGVLDTSNLVTTNSVRTYSRKLLYYLMVRITD